MIGLVICSSLILGFTCAGAWITLNQLSDDMNRVTQRSVPKLSHLSDMRYMGSEVTRLFLRVSTVGLTEAEVTRLKGKLNDHVDLYKKSEAEYLKMPAEAGEKELFDAQDEKWKEALKLIHEGGDLVGKTDETSVARMRALNSTVVAKAKVAHNESFQKLHEFSILSL